jgi:hypothetical protein
MNTNSIGEAEGTPPQQVFLQTVFSVFLLQSASPKHKTFSHLFLSEVGKTGAFLLF